MRHQVHWVLGSGERIAKVPPPNNGMKLTVQIVTRLARERARLVPICSAAYPRR